MGTALVEAWKVNKKRYFWIMTLVELEVFLRAMKVKKMIFSKILVKINPNLTICKKILIKEAQIKYRNIWVVTAIKILTVEKGRILNMYKDKTLKKLTCRNIKGKVTRKNTWNKKVRSSIHNRFKFIQIKKTD